VICAGMAMSMNMLISGMEAIYNYITSADDLASVQQGNFSSN